MVRHYKPGVAAALGYGISHQRLPSPRNADSNRTCTRCWNLSAHFGVSFVDMRHQPYKCMTFLLALLFAASSWMPMPARAEAQMRCAGVSPNSAPCARAELPAPGLTDTQVYRRLMACCRSMRGGCPMMRDCPMRPSAQVASHRSNLSAPRCLVSIRAVSVPVNLAAPRTRWLLTAAPALAPPATVQTVVLPTLSSIPPYWTYSPVLSPHASPHQHGLRAPPAA